VVRKNGERVKIAPWQIAEADNPVVDIAAFRPDFQGALYQFLTGLLQTVFAPEDEEIWAEQWQSPDPILKQALAKFSPAFELSGENTVAFCQDFDLPDGEPKPIANLLIEAPGGKTIKDNLDHFIKRGKAECMCESCAASALFTLQLNAPAGGQGHRVGIRGGGPLTSFVLPAGSNTLWQKLWLNVLPEEHFVPKADSINAQIFPWMAATRLSTKGTPTLPDDVDALHVFWGNPRRIRLESGVHIGHCALCGEQGNQLITHFRTKNFGINYDGPWLHPYTPYRFDPKNKELPLSLKGQQGGLGYRHWLALNWNDTTNGDACAKIINHINQERLDTLEQNNIDVQLQLWCFGFDMDNMKARCWYESQLPILHIPEHSREKFINTVSELLASARDALNELRAQIKGAWFSRPNDITGDTSMIDSSYWKATDPLFYQQLTVLAKQVDNHRTCPPEIAEAWVKNIRRICYDIFDTWVLEAYVEDHNMKRITQARRFLDVKLNKLKSLKYFENYATAESL